MLSNDTMGLVALAILWINTLLIAAAAGQQVAGLVARLRKLRPLRDGAAGAGLARARVLRGSGPDGAIAVHRVEQIGRAGADEGERSILFSDRSFAGEIFGGAVALDDGGEVTVEPSREAEVWLGAGEIERAAACPSDDVFDSAHDAARKARGFARTITARVGDGTPVFVLGERRGGALSATLVATIDPRAWIRRRIALASAFILAELALAGACTRIALWRPFFGTASIVGGALCLGFFLLVQPAGTALRDAVRVPSRAFVRGRWTRRAARGEAQAESAA